MTIQQILGFVRALGLLILSATPVFGQQLAAGTGRFIEVTIPAPSLAGNLLGDSTEQPASIYLPRSYDTTPNKRYPVIYLLHGFTGSNKTWMVDSELDVGEPPPGSTDIGYGYNIQPILDALIANGKIQEMIVVAPNQRNAYKGSQNVNSVVTGNWEDYIIQDVVNYVDGNFRTLARATSRGVAGHSMGANGAILLAMKQPDVFSAVYALAPGSTPLLGPFLFEGKNGLEPQWEETFRRLNALASKDQLPIASVGPGGNMDLSVIFSISAAYFPNPNRPPLYADYLYEERDGKLVRNEAAFEKAKTKSLIYLIDEYKDNLLSLRGLFLDWGEHDPGQTEGAQFSKALADRSIPHTFEIYAGGDHGNKIKERLETRVFPFFSDHLAF